MTSGEYQLQIRMQQVDEFPGSTIQFADIRYATDGIQVQGLPAHSPLIMEAGENGSSNDFGGAQTIGNLLTSDVATLGISGLLSNDTDQDWYTFDLNHIDIQAIPGVNATGKTVSVVFDLDYADQALNADTTLSVFDSTGRLIFMGRESNVVDDQPAPGQGNDIDDLRRGSLGVKDPYIGPIHLPVGSPPNIPSQVFYVAVTSDRRLPQIALNAAFSAGAADTNVRLEPINSVRRVVEDHIGFQGYSSNGAPQVPTDTDGIIDIADSVVLNTQIVPFSFEDVTLFVSTDHRAQETGDHLFTVNPFAGGNILTRVDTNPANLSDTEVQLSVGTDDIQDIVIRSDGKFYGYQELNSATSAGALVSIDPTTQVQANLVKLVGNDNIQAPTASTVYPKTAGAQNNNTERQFADLTTDFDANSVQAARQFETAALTFFRKNDNPDYDVFYAVTELDNRDDNAAAVNSKLYRGTADGSAAPDRGTAQLGVKGDIQPAGVTFANWSLTFDGDDDSTNGRVFIESKIPGSAGNAITITVSANNNQGVDAVRVGSDITLQMDNDTSTAQQVVDSINSDPEVRALITASVVRTASGQAANAGEANRDGPGSGLVTRVGGSDGDDGFGNYTLAQMQAGTVGPLNGRVTGLAFNNYYAGQLFGVTDAGEVLLINATRESLPSDSIWPLICRPDTPPTLKGCRWAHKTSPTALMRTMSSRSPMMAICMPLIPLPHPQRRI